MEMTIFILISEGENREMMSMKSVLKETKAFDIKCLSLFSQCQMTNLELVSWFTQGL